MSVIRRGQISNVYWVLLWRFTLLLFGDGFRRLLSIFPIQINSDEFSVEEFYVGKSPYGHSASSIIGLTLLREGNREMAELRYSRGTRSVDEVQRDVDEFWAEFVDGEELRKEVENAGFDVTMLDGVDHEGAIRVSARGAGIGPEAVAIVVAFAPSVNAALISLWIEVLLPRIRRRYGRDAIREEQQPRQ